MSDSSPYNRGQRPRLPARRMLRRALTYFGPGFFVTVGFIDPGNWATNIAAGSEFGYDLLWVITLSTAVLLLWQHMSAHLGIVTRKCLAESIHANMHPRVSAVYGSTAMAAIAATALAEILGAALGMNLLFGIPVRLGAMIAVALVTLLIWFQKYGVLEKLIVGFVGLIGFAYLIELYLVHPDWQAASVHSFVPTINHHSIIIAMGVLGAVIMPHNMYLHSEVIQSKQQGEQSDANTRRSLRYEFLDTLVAMLIGMAINAAMIIVAAAVFHKHGVHVTELAQASVTLRPLVGRFASLVFGIALLLAGISSSMTAGIAGGTTFSGYLGKCTELSGKWFRFGLVLTLVPALAAIMLIHDTFRALIISQVCLSIQLPFTMLPLFLLTHSRRVMGRYVNGWLENTLMIVTGVVIVVLNVLLFLYLLGVKY
jgi:manganese transport protein